MAAGQDDSIRFRAEKLEKRTGRTVPVSADDVLHAGDLVRFHINAPNTGYVAVLSRDGLGQVTVFYPYGETEAGHHSPDRSLLEDTIELDAATGRERVYAVWSPEPFGLQPLVAMLRRHAKLEPRGDMTVLELAWDKA